MIGADVHIWLTQSSPWKKCFLYCMCFAHRTMFFFLAKWLLIVLWQNDGVEQIIYIANPSILQREEPRHWQVTEKREKTHLSTFFHRHSFRQEQLVNQTILLVCILQCTSAWLSTFRSAFHLFFFFFFFSLFRFRFNDEDWSIFYMHGFTLMAFIMCRCVMLGFFLYMARLYTTCLLHWNFPAAWERDGWHDINIITYSDEKIKKCRRMPIM